MDAVIKAHEQLESRSNLSKSLSDVQDAIATLERARQAVLDSQETSVLTMARLKQPVKSAFEKLDDDLKEVNKGLNQYQKALDKKFKKTSLPTASTGPLAERPELIDRALFMHLLREGNFDIAASLDREIAERRSIEQRSTPQMKDVAMQEVTQQEKDWRGQFTEMYTILDALKNQHNLSPAIKWARKHSLELEQRGSNLEFELSRLEFVELYTSENLMSDDPWEGQLRALQYAQAAFQNFGMRYTQDLANLLGSLAFANGLETSPYRSLFSNRSSWEEASNSFVREFCGLLGLSERSPLYTAVTAGSIALPVLEKLESVVAKTGGQWTSPNELPAETPLPYSFKFHSIFVCPVSKEQATDANPPMMLPCGHVIAQQSLDAHAKGKNRIKCPYCPVDCSPRDARRIFI